MLLDAMSSALYRSTISACAFTYNPIRSLGYSSSLPLGLQIQRHSNRGLHVSYPRRATACVRNPQVDEDGNPMQMELTSSAVQVCMVAISTYIYRSGSYVIQRLNQIMAKEANAQLALRIQVESGGCHGFQYLMSLVTLPENVDSERSDSLVVSDDDVIFQFVEENGTVSAASKGTAIKPGVAKMILDTASLDLLKGSKVDFQRELIGSEFKIKDNPAAKSACGCGTSFDIKL